MVQEQYVVDTRGKKLSVILPLERYERLLEDLHDDEQPIGFEEMKRRSKEDGILSERLAVLGLRT